MSATTDRCETCNGELLTDDAYCAQCGTQVAAVSTRSDSRVSTHVARDPEINAPGLPQVPVPSRAAESAQGTSLPSEHAISHHPVDELNLRLEQAIRAFTEGTISATTLGRIEADLNLQSEQAGPQPAAIPPVVPINTTGPGPEDVSKSAPYSGDSAIETVDSTTSVHRDANTQDPMALVVLPDSQEVIHQPTPFVDGGTETVMPSRGVGAEDLDTAISDSGSGNWAEETSETVESSSASSTGVIASQVNPEAANSFASRKVRFGIALVLVVAAFLITRAAQDNTVQPSVPIGNTPLDIPEEAPVAEPFVVSTYCQQGAPMSRSGVNYNINDALNSPTQYGPGRVVLVWSDGSQTSGGGSC